MLGARQLETAVCRVADGAWRLFQSVNTRVRTGTFQPIWAPTALPRSSERTSPQLGWPRTTDSLCPTCVRETRARILSGEQAMESLITAHVGEIKAHILERDGKVIIEKRCPIHGEFTDTLAINPAFLRRLESLFPGRDFPA